MSLPESRAVSDHRRIVEEWIETTREATAGYPAPLTAAQRAAYLRLPRLIQAATDAYFKIPYDQRPAHFLMTTEEGIIEGQP